MVAPPPPLAACIMSNDAIFLVLDEATARNLQISFGSKGIASVRHRLHWKRPVISRQILSLAASAVALIHPRLRQCNPWACLALAS